MSEKIHLDIDATAAYNTLNSIESATSRAQQSINALMSGARAAYLGVTSLVRMGGGTISTLFSSVISAGISMVSILIPILTGKAAAGDYIQAGIGLANMGIAIAAIAAAETQKTEVVNRLHSANALMHSIQMMFGSIATLW